jgi:hypothetical protein
VFKRLFDAPENRERVGQTIAEAVRLGVLVALWGVAGAFCGMVLLALISSTVGNNAAIHSVPYDIGKR